MGPQLDKNNPGILWKPDVHYSAHTRPSSTSTMSRWTPPTHTHTHTASVVIQGKLFFFMEGDIHVSYN
jgi:hypothetical protein